MNPAFAPKGMIGTGEPVDGKEWSETVWEAQEAIRKHLGHCNGMVRIHMAGDGLKFADIRLAETKWFGNLPWQGPAPVYAISAEAIMAAAE